MSDELNDPKDGLNPDGGNIQPESILPEIDEIKAKAAKAEEYKGFADRVAKENKELKTKLEQATNKPNISPDVQEQLQRLDLKTDGYKEDEIDFILKNGGRDALKDQDSLVVTAIEAKRAKQRSLEATPSGTGKSAVLQQYTEQDLKNMPLADLEKLIPR